jgi:hypothetical protein
MRIKNKNLSFCANKFKRDCFFFSCLRPTVRSLHIQRGFFYRWAIPDKSVTSGTGLTVLPECRCLTTFFRHLLMIYQRHIERMTPSAAVYGCSGCINIISSMDVQKCIPFTNNSCMDAQGAYPIPSPRMDTPGVSISTASSMDVHCLRLASYIP